MYRRTVIISTAVSQARRAASNNAKTGYVHATVAPDSAKPISDERVKPVDHGEPPGAFPSSAMYKHFPDADQEAVDKLKAASKHPSSTSSTPAHPGTTQDGAGRAGQLQKDEDGVGWSSAVRYRSAPGEMSTGGEGGLGLMDESKKPE